MTCYVGLDLGWTTGATGVAVVDETGALLASGRVQTDDEIADWIAQHAPGCSVVAVDAPLVVPNETGQRVPERLIGKAFGAFGASAHTSNRATFGAAGSRALRLARHLGWGIDPERPPADDGTVCIEVYPHPAMVGLFELDYRLDYKKGRSSRRAAGFVELADHLEAVPELGLERNLRWVEIRRVLQAPRSGELTRLEDELDAILCAHLAWLWRHRPSALVVYGNLEDGYIVAPPPPTHRPRSTAGVQAEPATRARDHLPSAQREVVGRPTGYAGGLNESNWKAAVRAAFKNVDLPRHCRVAVGIEFRLATSQNGRNEPDLDNLVKSTIDALDEVLGRRSGTGTRVEADDVRITQLTASKRTTTKAEDPGATVTVSALVDEHWTP